MTPEIGDCGPLIDSSDAVPSSQVAALCHAMMGRSEGMRAPLMAGTALNQQSAHASFTRSFSLLKPASFDAFAWILSTED